MTNGGATQPALLLPPAWQHKPDLASIWTVAWAGLACSAALCGTVVALVADTRDLLCALLLGTTSLGVAAALEWWFESGRALSGLCAAWFLCGVVVAEAGLADVPVDNALFLLLAQLSGAWAAALTAPG